MTDTGTHWQQLYASRVPTQLSWYQAQPDTSLALIARAGLTPESHLIDVGGGTSTLVDALLARGFRYVTVLDVAATALEVASRRLGGRARDVTWIEADVTRAGLPRQAYDLWHDRALFHFFTDAEDRRRYVDMLREALRPGGQVILATFAPSGPPRCSGLVVERYKPEDLTAALGTEFTLLESVAEAHATPAGVRQDFVYCRFRKANSPSGE